MMPSPVETTAKWREQFVLIYRDVQDLAIQRYLYREVMAIAVGIPGIDDLDQTVIEWMMKMHAHSAAVAVRKQVDPDPDSVSFHRLLEAIAEKPELLTRTDYLARVKPSRDPATEGGAIEADVLRHDMNERFDLLAGKGAIHPSASDIRADLAKLDAAATRLRRFVNKTIAHRDRRVLREIPTWDDLNAAIDLLMGLIPKYNELLDAGQAPGLVPTWQHDWKAIFRVPWLPPRTSPISRVEEET